MKLLGKIKNQEVYAYTLETSKASVEILTLGAIINKFSIKMKSGEVRNIVSSASTLEEHAASTGYFGQVVAPNANRIKVGKYTLDGKTYQCELNNGANNLHSGSANAGYKVWSVLSADDNSIVLETTHKDGEASFPGNMVIRVKYTLVGSKLTIEYEVSTDSKSLCNITNHAYFNLNGTCSSVLEHQVETSCDYYLDVDETSIPVAKVFVENTDFDFRNKTKLSARRGGAYDHFFVFGKDKYLNLYNDDLALKVLSDQEGIQIYSAEFTKLDNPILEGKSDIFQAVALETSGYPDAINNADYPSVVITKDNKYTSFTSYEIVEL